MVRGKVCRLGSESSAKRIEHKSPDPKQSPRALIYHHPKADITPCNQFTGRDVAAGIWRIGQPNLENILLISLYWSRDALELPKKFLDAIEWEAQNHIPVHVGGDLNAQAVGQRHVHGEGFPGGEAALRLHSDMHERGRGTYVCHE